MSDTAENTASLPPMNLPPINRALLSVSDKTGLIELARFLTTMGVEILSTGGSARTLQQDGIAVTEVSAHTGFPEIMDGRVKTLQPLIHGGLLALRDKESHVQAMNDHAIAPIDLLVVNLYPFEKTLQKDAPFDDCIENIDIGGPAMIRAAAKNHAWVSVVVDPEDYPMVMDEMRHHNGALSDAARLRLAATAFARTASYDSAVSTWLGNASGTPFLRYWACGGTRREALRYGENPHQAAAFYQSAFPRAGVATARQVQGKALSYNNFNDTDAAFELVAEFTERPACAIIKHTNPSGVSQGDTLAEAYQRAYDCDRTSAFGGIIAFNKSLDAATAQLVTAIFTEVIIAPDASAEACRIIARKPNLRLLLTDAMPDESGRQLQAKTIAGGLLVQGADTEHAGDAMHVVTKRAPTDSQWLDLRFAFTVAKHVKSNAIVYAKDGATVGIGAGQMNRFDSTRIAAHKARDAAQAKGVAETFLQDSVVASDAFFPFADGVLAATNAGATAIIQPGGSIRDEDVIAAADERDIAMVFTGIRHFRH